MKKQKLQKKHFLFPIKIGILGLLCLFLWPSSFAGASSFHMHMQSVCTGTITAGSKRGTFKKEPVEVITTRTKFANGQIENEYWVFSKKPPRKLIYVTKQVQPDETFIRINADGTGFTINEDEKTYFRGKLIDLSFQDIHGLENWLRTYPKPGSVFRQRGLNFDTRSITTLQYCIVPDHHVGLRGVILKGDKIVGFFKTNGNGWITSQRMFGVDFVRGSSSLCRTRANSHKIPSEICIGFDRPLSRPDRLIKLIFEIPGEVKIPSSRFVHVKYKNEATRVTITAPVPVEDKNEMIARFLKSDKKYPLADKRVTEFVENAVPSGIKTSSAQIQFLFKAVSTQIETGLKQRSVIEGIKRKNGDCVTKAEIFTTSCRKLQIPARTVYGLIVQADSQAGFVPHAWNEVWVQKKWYSMDTTRPGQKTDARYLHLGIEEPPLAADPIIWGNWPAMLVEETYASAIYKEGR